MTERGLPIVDGAPACPFVAFEDDRDERAASPDHRHRCYAEARPAPRALAHQEAYCLSSAFPVCPTFQDWARREAAHSRADGPRPAEPLAAAAVSGGQPQRNPPRDWSAPPPWAGRGDPDADEDPWSEAGPAGEDVPRRGRGLSGSFADRVAGGAPAGGDAGTDAGAGGSASDAGDDGLAAGMAGEAAGGAAAEWFGAGRDAAPSDAPAQAAGGRERQTGQVAAFEGGDSRATPPPPRHERRRDPGAPEWERPRALDVYPTLRSRRLPELSVPPLLVAVVALALAAAVLFALPGLLGFGSPSSNASPSPSTPAASAVAQTFVPTAIPEPTQQVYIVQSGDTMSKIAKKFHVTLDDLIAANAENIPDPDRLAIGDQVIIPVAQPSEVPAASTTP